MDIRSLRYFTAVYEEESVSAASKRCFIAQPSISTAIAQLEEKLGVSLFLRHPKGVTPTPEGREFYQAATRLLGEFEALSAIFHQEEERLPLDLAIMPTIDARRLGDFLKRVTADANQIALRIVDMGQPADARVIADRLKTKGEHFVHLWDERYVLALPPNHRLTLLPRVEVKDLHGIRFIERCLCEVHDEVSGLLGRNKVSTHVVARASNEEWAVALVGAGVGAALVPEGSVRGVDGVVVREVDNFDIVRRVGLAYDTSRTPSQGLKALLQLVPPARGARPLPRKNRQR